MARQRIDLATGRKWAFLRDSPDLEAQLTSRVVSIWATKLRNEIFDCVGTGFVVGSADSESGKSFVIVITACHVLEYALQLLRPDLLRHLQGPFKKTVAKLTSRLFKDNSLRVCLDAGSARGPTPNYAVRKCAAFEQSDLTVIFAETSGEPSPFEILAIDSDPVPVGTQVISVGYPNMYSVDEPLVYRRPDGSTKITKHLISAKLEIRLGSIVKVHPQMRHKPVFGYELDSPIPAGMSGGPLFAFNDDLHTPLSVVGVCMSDSKISDAQDTRTSGSSFVNAAQNIYTLPNLATKRPKIERGYISEQDAVGGFFIDKGKLQDELFLDILHDGFRIDRIPREAE